MLSTATMPEYLFSRTAGIVGLLERLIEDGCSHAIDTGAEQLTCALLDSVDITVPHTPHREPDAGEVPAVPPRPSSRRRPRNAVFDDRGTATA